MLKLTHPTVDIAIVCSNFEESLHFYHQCLGFEMVMDIKIPAEVAKVRLQAGNTLIKLIDIELPPEPIFNEFNPGVRWLTIFVEDVHETVRDLKQNGVTFLAESIAAPDAAGVVCAEDPDGVLIEFVQV